MSLLNWSYSQCLVRDLIDIWSLHVPIIDFFLQTQSSIRKIHANLKIFLKMSWSELFFYAFLNKKTKQNTLHMYKLHRNTDFLMHCKVSFFNCNSCLVTIIKQWQAIFKTKQQYEFIKEYWQLFTYMYMQVHV